MPANKNQHFVPRCYLRAFSLDGAKKAINIFNINTRQFISAGPLKSQCSKDSFYGNDAALEKALQASESAYANLLKEITTASYRLKNEHRIQLIRFWLLQFLRTDASSKRAAYAANDMQKILGEHAGPPFDSSWAVNAAMTTYADHIDVVDDLKLCLIRNLTSIPFIASDDPAILSNRWHLMDGRTRGRSYGLNSSGALLLLPLTPSIFCVAYDGDVYSIEHENGWARIKSENDVIALNQHQYLNCNHNIYFENWDLCNQISKEFESCLSLRKHPRHRLTYSIYDHVDGNAQVYKVVGFEEAKEAKEAQKALMHLETIYSRPSRWPGVISNRNKGAVYSNGTGVGYIRSMQVLHQKTPSSFIKEQAHKRI